MKLFSMVRREGFSIEMLRDECTVIERRPGDPAALKSGLVKLHRALKKMPPSTVATLDDLRRTRESRGRV